MKTLLTLLTSLSLVSLALAAEEKAKHGPQGGELLNAKPNKAEFIVGEDHIATIAFYDDAMKPVPATDESAIIWAEPESRRIKVEFEAKNGALVSKKPLPEGEYPMMIRLKSAPDAKSQNFKIEPHHDDHGEHDDHGHEKGDGHDH